MTFFPLKSERETLAPPLVVAVNCGALLPSFNLNSIGLAMAESPGCIDTNKIIAADGQANQFIRDDRAVALDSCGRGRGDRPIVRPSTNSFSRRARVCDKRQPARNGLRAGPGEIHPAYFPVRRPDGAALCAA